MKIWLSERSPVPRGKGKGCDARSAGCIPSGFLRWLITKSIGQENRGSVLQTPTHALRRKAVTDSQRRLWFGGLPSHLSYYDPLWAGLGTTYAAQCSRDSALGEDWPNVLGNDHWVWGRPSGISTLLEFTRSEISRLSELESCPCAGFLSCGPCYMSLGVSVVLKSFWHPNQPALPVQELTNTLSSGTGTVLEYIHNHRNNCCSQELFSFFFFFLN